LYLLDISLGDMGIPKLELLSILHLISSLFIPYTWKLPSYKTSHNSISIRVNQPFWFSFKLKNTTYKAYTTVSTSSKVAWSKELKKKAIERPTQIVAEICQTEQLTKVDFFEDLLLLKLKSAKLMKVWI
jgi:hypothetical protein